MTLYEEQKRKDIKKRTSVFAKPRGVVLIKIYAMGVIEGLPKLERDEKRTDDKHAQEAKKRGLDPAAYRSKPDTGFELFHKEEGVGVINLLPGLTYLDLWLKYVGGHWQNVKDKGPVNTLVFKTPENFQEGEHERVIPRNIVELLSSCRFNHCTVWCNLKYKDNGEGQYRLDTINLAKGRKADKRTRELIIVGNTYRIVKQQY